jgi:hypothetical protein
MVTPIRGVVAYLSVMFVASHGVCVRLRCLPLVAYTALAAGLVPAAAPKIF